MIITFHENMVALNLNCLKFGIVIALNISGPMLSQIDFSETLEGEMFRTLLIPILHFFSI